MTSTVKTKKVIHTEVEALKSKLQNKKDHLECLLRKLARTQFEIQKLQKSIKGTALSLKRIRETVEAGDRPRNNLEILFESGTDPEEDPSDSEILIRGALDESQELLQQIDFLTMFFNIEG